MDDATFADTIGRLRDPATDLDGVPRELRAVVLRGAETKNPRWPSSSPSLRRPARFSAC